MTRRLFLIHWNSAEASSLAAPLQAVFTSSSDLLDTLAELNEPS